MKSLANLANLSLRPRDLGYSGVEATDLEPLDGAGILVVEDNPVTLDYMALVLDREGFRVLRAPCLAAAFEVIDDPAVPLDAMVSDIELPDGTGLDLVRRLHAARPRRVPAIAVSGFGSNEDVRLSLAAGFLAHLTKPVDVDRLLGEIRAAVASTRQRRVGG